MFGDDDVSRRNFLQLTGAAAVPLMQSTPFEWDEQAVGLDEDVEGYGLLMGPEDARPPAQGEYFEQWDTYNFAYFATDTGAQSKIQTGDTEWTEIMGNPTTQVDELRTENFESFFNHTFARPNAPDDTNWTYTDADVTKDGSEIELAATTTLETNQRGNYPPGSEAIPGVAMRVTGTPTGGRGDAGYFDDNDGLGIGEDATDSYVFIRNGGTEHQVYREDWNVHVPDSRVWANNRPVITRFPHLFYGGGDLEVRAILHDETKSELTTLHRFTPDNMPSGFDDGPPIDQPNLPVRFESSSLAGGSVRANACHYEFGNVETQTRMNGEHFSDVTVSDTGWTPLLLWQKRDGWEMVNIEPLKIRAFAETNDVKLEMQLNPSLSSVSTSLPENTSGDETAVELIDVSTVSVDALGERRWVSYAAQGQGGNPGDDATDDLDFNLPANQPVGLFAQAVGGSATVSGTVVWEEFF